MRLDLGGIAKGYALDRALGVLKQHGIGRALVQAGGDIAVGEAPPGKTGWRIQVAGAERGHRSVTLANAAISTSGDTEQYADIAGTKCSHIVDPRLGLRCGEPILATVIAPDATTTDSLATAACVLGREQSLELLGATPGVSVYVRPAPPARLRRRSALPDMMPCSSSGLNSDSRVTFRIALSG
jgi:thiamine biosynthesis lipoprotein